MRATPTKVRAKPLVTTTVASWPLAAPISVALAPDAKNFAYTTAGGELYVQPLAGGEAKRWTTTAIESPISLHVAGFYSDGSLAVLSTTAANEWRLSRLTAAGTATLVHSARSRLFAAISPVGDKTIVATESTLAEVVPGGTLREVLAVKPEERIRGIAISPDGTRIASMRSRSNEATESVFVTSMTGAELGRQQRFGNATGFGNELLAWIDNERFVFVGGDAANEKYPIQVYAAGVDDGLPETRDIWPLDGYVGLGSAAKGILLVIRGKTSTSVQTAATPKTWPLARANDAAATRVIGWTGDGRPVYASGFWREERIMRGSEPWPGTKAGDEGDAVVGDAVILHRMVSSGIAVERLDAAGKRTTLAQISLAQARWRPQLVRCAGEHAAPCMIEDVEYDHTNYLEIDPVTGKRGKLLHAYPVISTTGPTPNAALSPDGKVVAIVDESATITFVADGKPQTVTLEGVGALDSITFAANDELWASARDVHGRPFAFLRLTLDRATMQVRFDPKALPPGDALRVYTRPTVSRDRSQIAIGVRELHTEITRVDGL